MLENEPCVRRQTFGFMVEGLDVACFMLTASFVSADSLYGYCTWKSMHYLWRNFSDLEDGMVGEDSLYRKVHESSSIANARMWCSRNVFRGVSPSKILT